MFKELEEFELCTQTLFDGDSWDISCKLGLWGVSCSDKDQVQDEALHYFRQYKGDGEYSSIIGGDNVMQSMIKKGLI